MDRKESKQPAILYQEEFSLDDSEVSQLHKYVPSKMETFSLAEAAARINPSHLKSFLDTSPDWTWSRVMHFIDYFGEAFSGLSCVQFPWPNMHKLSDWIDFPISQIPKPVYETSACWISQVPLQSLCDIVVWSFTFIGSNLDRIPAPPKSKVAVFVVLAMVLRVKPLAFSSVLPYLRDNSKHFVDMLPVTVWMIAQASQACVPIALFSWARNLLPLLGSSDNNPHSVDLILQLAECIVSSPDARAILLRNAVRNADLRLIPPPSFEILLQLTFPASSATARVRDTKRFQEIYPLLKEVALANAPGRGRSSMTQVTHPIFTLSLKLAGHPNPVLAKEALSIAKWCVTKNMCCCNLWDQVYEKNLEASVALLKTLVDDWDNLSIKVNSTPSDALTLDRTMKSFMLKNKSFLNDGDSLYKEADKYSKEISGRLCNIPNGCYRPPCENDSLTIPLVIESLRLHRGNVSRRNGFIKAAITTAMLIVAVVAAPLVVLTSNRETRWALKN